VVANRTLRRGPSWWRWRKKCTVGVCRYGKFLLNWQSTDMLPRVENPTLLAPSRQCWEANGSLREAGNAAQELFLGLVGECNALSHGARDSAFCGGALCCDPDFAPTNADWSRTERRSRASGYTSLSSPSSPEGVSTGLPPSVPVDNPSNKHLHEAAILLR
jgi:hypothetical protein